MRTRIWIALSWTLLMTTGCRTMTAAPPPPVAPRIAPVVLMSDFGLRDGAVSAMRGVALGVDPSLSIHDLTHEIPPYDIWQASLRLQQTYRYWPAGTVFVTVVDPGVGSTRRSLVVRTKSGHYFVGPDNGYLTMVLNEAGLDGVRVIDEAKSRRLEFEGSHTFHGRDIYAYVGAQLAAGRLNFEATGTEATLPPVRLSHPSAVIRGGMLAGTLTVLDVNFGNVWTDVPKAMLTTTFPNARELRVYVAHRGRKIFEGILPIVATFAAVPKGQPLIYVNSLMNLALAINQASFARLHKVEAGPEWTIVFSKP